MGRLVWRVSNGWPDAALQNRGQGAEKIPARCAIAPPMPRGGEHLNRCRVDRSPDDVEHQWEVAGQIAGSQEDQPGAGRCHG